MDYHSIHMSNVSYVISINLFLCSGLAKIIYCLLFSNSSELGKVMSTWLIKSVLNELLLFQCRVSQPERYWHLETVLCCGGRPVRCGMVSRIPGLHLLNASSLSQPWQPKTSPDIAKCPVGGKIAPGVRITVLKYCSLPNKKALLTHYFSFSLFFTNNTNNHSLNSI